MSQHIKPYGNFCIVELKLPWDLAELLVEQGPSLLEDITIALAMRRQKTENNEKFASRRWLDLKNNKREFYSLGREVERRIRRCLDGKKDPAISGPLSNSTAVRTREVLKQLAVDYDTSASALDRYRILYVKDRTKRMRQRRDGQIVRYHFAGLTNKKIASKFKMHPETVNRIIGQNRDVLEAFRRLHPFELSDGGTE